MTSDEIAAARKLVEQLRSYTYSSDHADVIEALCDEVEGLRNVLKLIAFGKGDTVDRMIARDALRMKRDDNDPAE